ncbi:MAG: cofactor-independent phosphoglycerate mutase [Syntrophobacteraceae bacterium]
MQNDKEIGWKYIVLVGDGMGDYPLDELGGLTPLEVARTPNIDRLVPSGQMGTVQTIPDSMEPGSDVANMSLLGYNPKRYHTGRAPLEAASMGVELEPADVAFRCNLVTLEKDAAGITRMLDYSAGHISTDEAREIIASLQEAVKGSRLRLYPGVSYRHLLVWPAGRRDLQSVPPHDISGQPSDPFAKVYESVPELLSFIEKAAAIMADHPVNRSRVAAGKSPANAVWLWGQGTAPTMPTLQEKAGLTGAIISAVDLLKGLGVYAGLDPIEVPGATGYLDTNYAGKVSAALKALDAGEFVFVHIEAPDETSHEGNLSKKIEAIEAFDEKVVGPVVAGALKFDRVRLLIIPDHLTPIHVRTHVSDPVPFLMLKDLKEAAKAPQQASTFSERNAKATGLHLNDGEALFEYFIGRNESQITPVKPEA